MSRTEEIIKGLTSAMSGQDRKKQTAYDTPATVTRIEGDTAWVHINGGVSETPVKLTISAKVGDTVQVRVGGGTAWLVGNQTAPPTDDTVADKAIEKAEEAGKTATDYVTDDSDGLFVHPRDNTADGVRIKKTVEILRGGKSVAEYGDTARVGEIGKGHVVIDGQNFHLYTAEVAESARIGIEDASTLNIFGAGNSVELNDEAEAVVTIAGTDNQVVDGLSQVVIMGKGNTVDGNGVAIGDDNEIHGTGTTFGTGLYYDYSTGGGGTKIYPPADGEPLVVGCYNRKTADQGDYAFIVGNGSGENDRKDAFKVDWNGGLYSDTRKLFAKESKSVTSASVNAGATLRVAVPISKTGYTPWGIEGVQLTNSAFSYYTHIISGTNAVVYIKNNGSSAGTTGINLDVSYIATSAL